ncbi:hypothetical protein [Catenuloplanes japonicus]|uniref:hypothetical protein n=1 Tax=Catenuloplanes japonicus TaxID=33876 RepID=UPI000525959F|nr:hypothetical protein [Catenuloplanes japonicus]
MTIPHPLNGTATRPSVPDDAASPPSPFVPPQPAPPVAAPPWSGPPPITFGLCGAAGGGKTTFLASLSIAVGAADGPMGRWRITPADEASLQFLVDREQELVAGRRFPGATQANTSYRWQIDGDPPAERRRGLFPRARAREGTSFTVDVEDRPGGDFLLDAANAIPISEEGLNRLADADALVFLFDPLREIGRTEDTNSNWLYLSKLIQTLKMRRLRSSSLPGGRLPHHVAVCVTKFDDPAVFLPAWDARLIDIGEDGVPRVPPGRAQEYFTWICAWISRQSVDFSTEQFRNLLRGSFADDRVHYFGTSSVGFWTGPDGRFRLDDFQNFERVNNEWRLRGQVRPVNVLEPLVGIERAIRLGGRR